MNNAFPRLMNDYARSLASPKGWLRRIALVGCALDEGAALCADMSDMASGLFDLPARSARFTHGHDGKRDGRSVLVGCVDGARSLKLAFDAAGRGDLVIAAYPATCIEDVLELVTGSIPGGGRLNSFMNAVAFCASVAEHPSDRELVVAGHLTMDPGMQRSLMETDAGRWAPIVRNATIMETSARISPLPVEATSRWEGLSDSLHDDRMAGRRDN